MTPLNLEIGLSASSSAGASAGAGDFVLTGGNSQAWVPWAIAGLVLALFLFWRKS